MKSSFIRLPCVYIPLANHLHAQWVIRALQADKPVLVEKPLCLNTEEFDAIAKAAWEHGVPCVEAVMAAYHPWQAALADLIDSEQYGALQETHTQINVSTKQLPPNNYRFFAEYGGGGI